MVIEKSSNFSVAAGRPAALMLAETVERIRVPGQFDSGSQTWSNREFACAGAKKHNEAM